MVLPLVPVTPNSVGAAASLRLAAVDRRRQGAHERTQVGGNAAPAVPGRSRRPAGRPSSSVNMAAAPAAVRLGGGSWGPCQAGPGQADVQVPRLHRARDRWWIPVKARSSVGRASLEVPAGPRCCSALRRILRQTNRPDRVGGRRGRGGGRGGGLVGGGTSHILQVDSFQRQVDPFAGGRRHVVGIEDLHHDPLERRSSGQRWAPPPCGRWMVAATTNSGSSIGAIAAIEMV